ncbi:MAG: dTDP-4-dehydrorhamnose 3,5-epimerase, partial [Myxococcales bacterium]|nr:dTDP-4-dehydrorhamnose 3,5-epimerase [Myxococcales bacterium]
AYGRFFAATLSSQNFLQIYVPPGLVHGFVVTSETAEVEYKTTDFYHPESEFSVAWNDPALAIPWPVAQPILSEKDAKAMPLAALQDRLIDYAP